MSECRSSSTSFICATPATAASSHRVYAMFMLFVSCCNGGAGPFGTGLGRWAMGQSQGHPGFSASRIGAVHLHSARTDVHYKILHLPCFLQVRGVVSALMTVRCNLHPHTSIFKSPSHPATTRWLGDSCMSSPKYVQLFSKPHVAMPRCRSEAASMGVAP